MKRIALGLLLMVMVSASYSQRQYFIYLQSEPQQAFFIKMNEKIHSSTSSGYLILSRLGDSSYSFTVGFPQNKWPEQKFAVDVKGKDHGYLLKNYGDKGWGLLDLQTAAVQMGTSKATQKTESRNVSAFTDILSKAANDPSLKERPVTAEPAVVKEDKKTEAEPAVVKQAEPPVTKRDEPTGVKKVDSQVAPREEPTVTKKDESSTGKNDQPTDVKKDQPPIGQNNQALVTKKDESSAAKKDEPANVKKQDSALAKNADAQTVNKDTERLKTEEIKTVAAEGYKRSVITRRSESSTSEGLGLSFTDEYGNGKKDTIAIFIPNPKSGFSEPKTVVKEEKKFLDIGTSDTVVKNDTVPKPVNKQASVPVAKKGCVAVAVEADFLKLRKKMAAETTDDGMVDEARKYFKTKCFTSIQIKNLSTLFLADDGKYKFFDAAYTYVSDRDNFASLEAELKDQYYINRFKAMLR
jgi:hypothetical protein